MTDAAYKPFMSPELAEQNHLWHEKAYASLRARKSATVSYLGRSFAVPADVFPPAPMSELLGKAILHDVRASDRVLDMGTGCGVNAILAASQALDVVGVDINPHAITTARKNAAINNVAARVRFYESDVFDRVDGDFDLMFFGSSGDLDYVYSLIDKSDFDKEVVSERTLIKDNRTVHYYVFCLSRFPFG